MSKSASEKNWVEVGRSTSSDKENKKRAEVKLDDYYVVIGFEVNHPDAYQDGTHDLAKDYGHAFYYIVKNKVITKIFSFGPAGAGKIGWFSSGNPALLKNGYNNSRPADADYSITETVSAFRIKLTLQQGRDLETETDEIRKKIKANKIKYVAYLNDTCAETARDILKSAEIETPGGMGKIKHSKIFKYPVAYATNPYKWHENFKKEGFKEVKYKPPLSEWHPPLGDMDPISWGEP